MKTYPITIDPVTINAPIQSVWDILTDFNRYSEWNTFTPKIETNLVLEGGVLMYIYRGSKKPLRKQKFQLKVCEPPYEIAWSFKMLHSSIFSAYRQQTLTAVSDNQCIYKTVDNFAGLLAPSIYKSQHTWVAEQFIKVTQALKERAESQ